MHESLMERDEMHGHNKHAARVMKMATWTYLRSMTLIYSGLRMTFSIKPSHLSRAMCGFIARVSKPTLIVSNSYCLSRPPHPRHYRLPVGGHHQTRHLTRCSPVVDSSSRVLYRVGPYDDVSNNGPVTGFFSYMGDDEEGRKAGLWWSCDEV